MNGMNSGTPMNDEPPVDEQPVDGEVVTSAEDARKLAVADDVLPETLYIMPISTRPYFPGQVQPVALNMARVQSQANNSPALPSVASASA